MNHWQLVEKFVGRTVQVYDNRLVRIIGASVPGHAFCQAVDGLGTISEISTAFLTEDRANK